MLLFVFLLTSCLGSHRNQPVLKQAGESFVTSHSPCLDSALVNIDYAGCKSMTVSTRGALLKLTCVDPAIENNIATSPWLIYDFFVIQTDGANFEEMPMPICIDPIYTVFYYPKGGDF